MSLAGLSLRDLEYAVAVAELRHFGRAAEACGVSQSALSMQIKKIEDLLSISILRSDCSGCRRPVGRRRWSGRGLVGGLISLP